MHTDTASPLSLKIVSTTFVLAGALAAIEMLSSVTGGLISINFGVLGIPVGIGLLRHSQLWRVCGLVLACLGALCGLVLGIALFATGQPISYSGFGQTGTLPALAAVAFALVLLLVSVWQYRVLTRPHIKQLFNVAGNAA